MIDPASSGSSGQDPARLRIVGIADTDSYVKWAAHLLAAAGEFDTELLILDTPVVVSAAQLSAAIEGSGMDGSRVRRVVFAELAERLRGADVVLAAARGPLTRVIARAAAAQDPRPVIATGLPGISVPATRLALRFRRQCDLFVLHSHREIHDFERLARECGIEQRFALARLPFAQAAPRPIPAQHGTDLVFAAQAIVPSARTERMRIARLLVDAARADPDRRVVLKLRGAPGEGQTHREASSYPSLLRELGPLPPNLVISTEPMSRALRDAEGLATVSSTAAVEAVARGVPVIALDTFGVSDELINPVFLGSGLLAGEDAVIARRFRRPDPRWLRENYFHDPSDDDWQRRLRELVALCREGALAPRALPRGAGTRVRTIWERKLVLGDRDRSMAGVFAAIVQAPARLVLRLARRVRAAAGERIERVRMRTAARELVEPCHAGERRA